MSEIYDAFVHGWVGEYGGVYTRDGDEVLLLHSHVPEDDGMLYGFSVSRRHKWYNLYGKYDKYKSGIECYVTISCYDEGPHLMIGAKSGFRIEIHDWSDPDLMAGIDRTIRGVFDEVRTPAKSDNEAIRSCSCLSAVGLLAVVGLVFILRSLI